MIGIEELEFEMKDAYDFSKARRDPYAARANASSRLIKHRAGDARIVSDQRGRERGSPGGREGGALGTKGNVEQRKVS